MTIIAIVGDAKTPLAKVARRILQVGSSEIGFRFEPMTSRIAQLSVIDVLSVGVSLRRSDEVVTNLSKSRKALAKRKEWRASYGNSVNLASAPNQVPL